MARSPLYSKDIKRELNPDMDPTSKLVKELVSGIGTAGFLLYAGRDSKGKPTFGLYLSGPIKRWDKEKLSVIIEDLDSLWDNRLEEDRKEEITKLRKKIKMGEKGLMGKKSLERNREKLAMLESED